MTIFSYKGIKRENRAGSAEKQQQKASCVLLGRVKFRTDIHKAEICHTGETKQQKFL